MFRKLQRRPPALTFWAPLAHCPTPMTLEKGLQLSPWLLAKEDPKLCRLGPRASVRSGRLNTIGGQGLRNHKTTCKQLKTTADLLGEVCIYFPY